jgi:hypothetical protein
MVVFQVFPRFIIEDGEAMCVVGDAIEGEVGPGVLANQRVDGEFARWAGTPGRRPIRPVMMRSAKPEWL